MSERQANPMPTALQTVIVEAYHSLIPEIVDRQASTNLHPGRIRLTYNDAALTYLGERLLELAGVYIYGLPVELVEHKSQSVIFDSIMRISSDRPCIQLDVISREPQTLHGMFDGLILSMPITAFIEDELNRVLSHDWETPA